MNLSPRTQRLLALSGMLAPLSFIVLATTATLLTPGYDIVRQTVSSLAREGQPYGWLVGASFVLYALLVQPLGPLLRAAAPSRLGGALLWALIVQYGSGAALAAVYRTGDATPTLGGMTTNDMHHLVAAVSFSAILTLSFLTPFLYRGLAHWQAWRTWSLVLGVLTIAFMLPFQLDLWPEYRGLFQRGFFGTTMFWIFLASLRFYRLAHEARPAEPLREGFEAPLSK